MINGSEWYEKYEVSWRKGLPPDHYEIDKPLTDLKGSGYRLKILAGRMLLFEYRDFPGVFPDYFSGYASGAFVVAPHTWTHI